MLYPDSYFAQIIFSATSRNLRIVQRQRHTLAALISHHRRRIPSQHAQASKQSWALGLQPFGSSSSHVPNATPRTSARTATSCHGVARALPWPHHGWIDRTQDNPCEAISSGPSMLLMLAHGLYGRHLTLCCAMSHGWMLWTMPLPFSQVITIVNAGPKET